MSDPISITLMAMGTIISAVSAVRQGQYQEAMGKAASDQQEREAIARREKAEFDVQRHRENIKRFKGTQRMSLLKSGVQLEGSALDLLADTEIQAKMDEDIIRYNAEYGAKKLEWGARMSRFKGKQGKRAGEIQAFSSLLSSAGKYSSGSSYFT